METEIESIKQFPYENQTIQWQRPNLLRVGAPLPRRTAVQQHRRHQFRTLSDHFNPWDAHLYRLPAETTDEHR